MLDFFQIFTMIYQVLMVSAEKYLVKLLYNVKQKDFFERNRYSL